MGVMDFMNKMAKTMSKVNLATGGKDPTVAIFESLEKLGLKVVSNDGAKAKLAGTYKNREAGMLSDGSKVMKAGMAGMMDTAMSVVGDLTGLDAVFDDTHYDTEMRDFYAKDRMQRAQIMLMWTMKSATPASGSVNIGRSKDVGESIGNGLFAQGAALEAINTPEVKALLEKAPFDELKVSGNSCTAFWAPPMQEYQKVVSSPDAFTPAVEKVLDAMSAVCDKVCGPA